MATAIDPYKAYSAMYQKRTDAINAQTKQAETEKLQREKAAQETLANSNRGVYNTYKNAINPYGRMASQNNFSSGVSNFYNDASYGTMLQGLGSNQYNYNDAMNNSNSLWQNYLAQKAGQEADALNDYNSGVLAQQKYDKEQEIAEQERQEAIRQFNLNLQLKQEAEKAAQARWEAEQAENKRRYDQEWAAQEAARAAASSGGSSGGSSYRRRSGGGGDPVLDIPPVTPNPQTQQSTSYRHEQNGTTNGNKPNITKVEHQPSSISGKKWKITHYSDGTYSKELVKA